MMKQAAFALIPFLAVLILGACGAAGELNIMEAWARPAEAGTNSSVYLTIHNPTNQEDTLSAARSDIAAHVEIHRSEMSDDGTMRMHPQEAVRVPRGGEVAFTPGGLHIMLVDVQQDLGPGDRFQLTLNFETAGELTVEVQVQEP